MIYLLLCLVENCGIDVVVIVDKRFGFVMMGLVDVLVKYVMCWFIIFVYLIFFKGARWNVVRVISLIMIIVLI